MFLQPFAHCLAPAQIFLNKSNLDIWKKKKKKKIGVWDDNPSLSWCVTWCDKKMLSICPWWVHCGVTNVNVWHKNTIFPCVMTTRSYLGQTMSHHNVLYMVIMSKLTTLFCHTMSHTASHLGCHLTPLPFFSFFSTSPNCENFSKSNLLLLKKNWASAKQYANGCNHFL